MLHLKQKRYGFKTTAGLVVPMCHMYHESY